MVFGLICYTTCFYEFQVLGADVSLSDKSVTFHLAGVTTCQLTYYCVPDTMVI